MTPHLSFGIYIPHTQLLTCGSNMKLNKKLKIDKFVFTKLKGKESYKEWKQSIQMACRSEAVAYLLKDFENNIIVDTISSPAINVSQNQSSSSSSSANNSPMVDIDVLLTKPQWDQMSEQLVTKLFFFVDKMYQHQIASLNPCNIPTLFKLFDAQFNPSDPMILINKKQILDNISLKLDKTFLDQLVKFDEQLVNYQEAGGGLDEKGQIMQLIRALPDAYKDKIADAISNKPTLDTYLKVREQVVGIFERQSAWGYLPNSSNSSSSSSSSYPQRESEKERKESGLLAKGEREKGKGKKPERKEEKQPPPPPTKDKEGGGVVPKGQSVSTVIRGGISPWTVSNLSLWKPGKS